MFSLLGMPVQQRSSIFFQNGGLMEARSGRNVLRLRALATTDPDGSWAKQQGQDSANNECQRYRGCREQLLRLGLSGVCCDYSVMWLTLGASRMGRASGYVAGTACKCPRRK